jgi:hypothetical protein
MTVSPSALTTWNAYMLLPSTRSGPDDALSLDTGAVCNPTSGLASALSATENVKSWPPLTLEASCSKPF